MAKVNWKRWRLPELGLFLASIVFTLFLAEGVLRLGIRLDIGRLRDPALYTHPFCDDDYHKLRLLWAAPGEADSGRHIQHPQLGWVPNPESERALAAVERTAASSPQDVTIALFGDSFAAGVAPATLAERIGPLLDDRLPGALVVDQSVSGYGVDQIYLRFQEWISTQTEPTPTIAVVGILLDDLDRVIETFRDGPKPYFVTTAESVELRGVPIDLTSEQWVAKHPVRFKSFLLARGESWHRDWREWRDEKRTVFEDECRREEKETLNRFILTELVSQAREMRIRPVFVIFYGERALTVKSWREDFLKATLDDLGAEVLDTRDLMASAAAAGIGTSEYYYPPPNGHPNPRGNALIADAIADVIGDLSRPSSSPADGEADQPTIAEIRFGSAAQNTIHLLRRGWETDSAGSSWTISTESSLQMPTLRPLTGPILQIDTLCVLRKPDDDRELTIAVADRVVKTIAVTEFPPCWTPASIAVELPADAIAGPFLRVSLHLDYLLTPREAGFEIEDARRLGMAVTSVSLRSGTGS